MNRQGNTNAYLIASGGYLLLCVIVLVLGEPSAFLIHAADGASWTDPATVFASTGGFIDPAVPGLVHNYRPPLYPIFVASGMVLFGDSYPWAVVLSQLGMVYGIALLMALVLRDWSETAAKLGFCLVLFNPNLFGVAFFVQSEVLNALFVTTLGYALFRYARNPKLSFACLAAFSTGLACLTRPEGAFLFILVPFALALLNWRRGWGDAWRKSGIVAALAFTVTALTVSPWMTYNYQNGDGYKLSASGSTSYFIWGNATQLEMQQFGIPEREAERRMSEARAQVMEGRGAEWASLSPLEREDVLIWAGVDKILSYETVTVITMFTKATGQFLLAGGAGRLFALAGSPDAAPFAVMVQSGHSDHFTAVLDALSNADLGLLLVWAVAVGYVLVTRIFGLIGLYKLCRDRNYGALLIVVAGIGFYVCVMPFYGLSRFRVSVEFLFVLLAALGMLQTTLWRSRG